MVKGNWERRVERAAKQKAAKRDAAAAKAKGQLVDPLDILNAVFLKDPDASVWVAAAGSAKLCAAYFRNGDCPNRRCKWSHAETLAPWSPSATGATTEPPLEQVPTVAERLDGAVPKAEFNDGSVLAPLPEGVVARVLDAQDGERTSKSAIRVAGVEVDLLRPKATLDGLGDRFTRFVERKAAETLGLDQAELAAAAAALRRRGDGVDDAPGSRSEL